MNAFWDYHHQISLSPAVFSVEFISQLRGRRHCPHCYLNPGWLSVFAICLVFTHRVFALLSAFVFSSGSFFIPFLHYWEGIRLFTTLLHLRRCMCGHMFFAYATKRRGSAVSSFPSALIIIVGTVLIFL